MECFTHLVLLLSLVETWNSEGTSRILWIHFCTENLMAGKFYSCAFIIVIHCSDANWCVPWYHSSSLMMMKKMMDLGNLKRRRRYSQKNVSECILHFILCSIPWYLNNIKLFGFCCLSDQFTLGFITVDQCLILHSLVRCMMYGFGDDQNPYTESVDLLEDLVIEYISEMVR